MTEQPSRKILSEREGERRGIATVAKQMPVALLISDSLRSEYIGIV